jgi:leucyl/phenylalanyl-tRNA--protein transferase
MFTASRIRPDPDHILWHVAMGAMPGFVDERAGSVGWVRLSHRGIQYLDRLAIPRKQKNYIFSPRWDIRFNTAFEQVVRACADVTRPTIQKRTGRTWITQALIRGLLQLHRMGYAHSCEAWCDGALAGGVWGFQIGRYVSMNSMFHRVSNASKAAFARGQLHLRDLGFTWVDMNGVPDHLVDFGIEWVPQWKFEADLERQIDAPALRIGGSGPAPRPPWFVRYLPHWARIMERASLRWAGPTPPR